MSRGSDRLRLGNNVAPRQHGRKSTAWSYAGQNGTPTLARREGGVMYRLANGPTIFDRNGRGRSAAVVMPSACFWSFFSGLTSWAISTTPAGADIEHSNRGSFHVGAGASFHFQDPDLAALRDYAQQIAAQDSGPTSRPQLRVAEADSAFEALRDFLRKRAQPPESAPADTTNPPAEAPPSRPRAAPSPPTPSPPKAAAPPMHGRPIIDAHLLGANTCLFCHAPRPPRSTRVTIVNGSKRSGT
jgi:hypothetical protein